MRVELKMILSEFNSEKNCEIWPTFAEVIKIIVAHFFQTGCSFFPVDNTGWRCLSLLTYFREIYNNYFITDLTYWLNVFEHWLSCFPSVLWHCWLGDRKGIRPVKSLMLVCWCWWFDCSLRVLQLQLSVSAISVILSSNNIQNWDILVPANPGPPGKMAVKTERGR